MMMNCCVCLHNSGRMEICLECALMLWPHEVVNQGAKDLKHKVLAVPSAPTDGHKEVTVRHPLPLA